MGKAFAYKRPALSHGGTVEQNDDGSYDAKKASPTQLQMAIAQSDRENVDNDQATANFNELANYRTGQGVRQLQYRWGQGAQTAKHQQQPTVGDIVDQSMQTYDPDNPDQSQENYAQGGNVMATKQGEPALPYNRPPRNGPNNDHHQGHATARGGNTYSWGKVSPRFQNMGAEVTPHGHNELKSRKLAHGGGCSCWRCGGRFAKGGAAITPAWKDRPFAVSQHKGGNGFKIHAPRSGSGLVMNIHLSDVGPHAISFGQSGGVDASRMVERAAERRLASEARPQPLAAPQAPAVTPMGPQGFGALMGKLRYDA